MYVRVSTCVHTYISANYMKPEASIHMHTCPHSHTHTHAHTHLLCRDPGSGFACRVTNAPSLSQISDTEVVAVHGHGYTSPGGPVVVDSNVLIVRKISIRDIHACLCVCMKMTVCARHVLQTYKTYNGTVLTWSFYTVTRLYLNAQKWKMLEPLWFD
jgi:hypothetical protein